MYLAYHFIWCGALFLINFQYIYSPALYFRFAGSCQMCYAFPRIELFAAYLPDAATPATPALAPVRGDGC